MTVFQNILQDPDALVQILLPVQLGSSLMCACRLHYNYLNNEKPNPRVLDQYIQFTTCNNHMNQSKARDHTVTLKQLQSFDQYKLLKKEDPVKLDVIDTNEDAIQFRTEHTFR